MILGRGTAQTDEAIVAEYHQFLRDTSPVQTPTILGRLQEAPGVMGRRIGQPIRQWSDEAIVALYQDRQKATWYPYSAFLAFLFFRGYRQATLHLLTTLPLSLVREHRAALLPLRQRLEQAQKELRYAPCTVGALLTLLLWFLAVTGKPLEAVTRADFESFQGQYQAWYRQTNATNRADPRLARLERLLIHMGFLPAAPVVLRHEERFAAVRSEPIRAAILTYLEWSNARYQPSTIYSRRAALFDFFLWLQETHPEQARLDQVTRATALEYARYLNGRVAEGTCSPKYRNDLYRFPRLFFDFAIDERLEASPDRNPFALRDMPWDPDPVPRYLSDAELRPVLAYCQDGATLRERTMVIVLLHTGIRAAELAALKDSDLVQIQGQWKLHIHEGKGLKDRVIPLTAQCRTTLRTWQEQGWERANDYLFTYHGRPWRGTSPVWLTIHELGEKVGVLGLTPHRFRHTFAVALLNYGMRESALQKLMGHATLNMTLEYARILDRSVEQSFNQAVEAMRQGPLNWVPGFFAPEEYTVLAENDTLHWIRLPHGYCRRSPKLHCECDVKCLLCERFCAVVDDLPRLQEMHERFVDLGMGMQAGVVAFHLRRLQASSAADLSPVTVGGAGDSLPAVLLAEA